MLCDGCRDAEELGQRPEVGSTYADASVAALFCSHCCGLLPQADPDGSLLAGLSRLARFGISAGSGPLLVSGKLGV